MSKSREKWNRIYAERIDPGNPAQVLVDNANWLPRTGRALDAACGNGANAIFMANHGLLVDAQDISDVAIGKLQVRYRSTGLAITATAVDLTQATFEPECYDVISVIHYLERTLTDKLIGALKVGGLLYFQTFTQQKDICTGPTNPKFLLAQDELLSLTHGMEVLFYRDSSSLVKVAAMNTPPVDSATIDPYAGKAAILARKLAR
jgi:tellurite methyltransferase